MRGLFSYALQKARQLLAHGELPVDGIGGRLPTKATLDAGSSRHTVYRQPITVGCAQTFRRFQKIAAQ